MAEVTITLPEGAINTLMKLKQKDETIMDVLLRLIGSVTKKEEFLGWLERKEPNEDLGKSIEGVYKNRKKQA